MKVFQVSQFHFLGYMQNVARLTQMLSWRTLSSQQIENQPCVTVCCFTETAKIKDSAPHQARLQAPINGTTVREIHLFQAIF